MEKEVRVLLYPGTFDPITLGHLDVIKRALNLADKLVVAVAVNPQKAPLFSIDERIEMIKEAVKGLDTVEVSQYDGLTVDFALRVGARFIIRGLRAISDFEMEFQMALANRRLNSDVDTIFLMPSQEFAYLNSTLVKEIVRLGGDASGLVPKNVVEKLKEKFL
ncbi:MAG: pantetheine-phosphate adenylyltransferase [bacterium]